MNKGSPEERLFNTRYLMLVLVNFLVSISYSMVSTIMAKYAVSIGMTVAIAGSLTGAFSIASMCVRPFTGYINDHVSGRRLLMLSTLLMGLCTMGYGLVPSYGGLVIVRILHGMAFAFSSTVNMAVMPSLVPSRRVTEGISCFGVATSLGIAAGPSMGLWLVGRCGYQANFIVSALIAGAGAALAILLPRLDHPPKEGTKRFRLRLGDLFAKECLIYTLVDVTIAAANGLENSLLTLLGAQMGIANIGWYFTISAVVLFLTRILMGRVADRRGVAFVLYPGLVLMIAGFLLLWQAQAAWQFALASVLKTLGIGLARPAIQAACLHAVPPERRGSASSTYYIGSDVGQGTAPMIGGWLVDRTGGENYGLPFALFTLPLALSGMVYAIWKKWKHKEHVQHEASKIDA